MKNGSPRLLVLGSTFPGRADDGTPAFVRDLAIEMSSTFDVRVVTPSVPGSAGAERVDGVDVRRFRFFPRRWEDLADGAIIENLRARPSRWLQVIPFLVAEAVAVRRHVREFRPDVVHAHWIIPQGLVATLVAPRVPRVVTTLGGDLYALRSRPLTRLKSFVVRRASRVTVMNAEMATIVRELGAQEVLTRPMGADTGLFARVARSRRPVPGTLRLLFVGRLVEKKGLAVLVDALRGLGREDLQLSVVGDGPLRADLEGAAAGLPVTFLGQLGRADLAQVYAEHDVIVVPSVHAGSGDKDGLPVALLEAMAAGCAVVASDLPGINEAVRPGVDGVLVPSGDEAALGAALASLADGRAWCDELGERAAARADEFSLRRVGGRYAEMLLAVAGRAQARPAELATAHEERDGAETLEGLVSVVPSGSGPRAT